MKDKLLKRIALELSNIFFEDMSNVEKNIADMLVATGYLKRGRLMYCKYV